MHRGPLTRIAVGGIVLVAIFAAAPTASAQNLPGSSAIDQYSEAIPTAGGQKSSRSALTGSGGATVPIGKGKGSAAKLAHITAPSRSDSGSSGSGGLGFVLPLILVATLLAALAIFFARRRSGTTAS